MAEIKWPGGKKCAFFIGLDIDSDLIWRNMSSGEKNGDKFLRSVSHGKYEPNRSLRRILDLFRDFSFKATFYVPGWIAEHYPGVLETFLKEGHEIGHHGYKHEVLRLKSIEEQTEILQKSLEIFEKQTGVKGIGYRQPSSEWDVTTPALLHKLGFTYSSTMHGDDRPYRTVFDGKESDFIEIPMSPVLDDYSYTVYSIIPREPEGGDRIAGYEHWYDNTVREFDGYHRFGLCYSFMIHPQVSANGGRALILERFFRHVADKGDVYVATGEQIADYWRETY